MREAILSISLNIWVSDVLHKRRSMKIAPAATFYLRGCLFDWRLGSWARPVAPA